jgi:GNAT superfamily N-acetyltransferase
MANWQFALRCTPRIDEGIAVGIGGNQSAMPDVQIIRGYVPGAVGRVTELHAVYYHREWGFGLFFEARVAAELAEFLGRYDGALDGFWTAQIDGGIEGSIAIDGLHAAAEGAHLRWFIVSDALRGQGAGGRLIEAALGFCRACGYRRVYLNTFEGLHAARRLYERYGFQLVEQHPGAQWGRQVNEQRFELDLT